MTEAEWLASEDPVPMLGYLFGHPVSEFQIPYRFPRKYQAQSSDRKFRLYSVACYRRVWSHLCSMGARIVSVAEQHADFPGQELARLWEEIPDESFPLGMWALSDNGSLAAWLAQQKVFECVLEAVQGTRRAEDMQEDDIQVICDEVRTHVDLARDIFGNPFRPITFSPSWRTSTAVALASQMYESRDFGAMPILADALQDAGCDSADVLDHCRGPGPHVRGCWVVDLVLGKE